MALKHKVNIIFSFIFDRVPLQGTSCLNGFYMKTFRFIGLCCSSVLLIVLFFGGQQPSILSDLRSGVSSSPQPAGRPLSVSGIYPHLVMYNPNRAEIGKAGESGIGVVVPWAGRLWALTYPAHFYTGSSDRLYTLDSNLNLEIRSESTGGTHANRMIHRESDQLFMGYYVIDSRGKVRTIPPSEMPGRLTANARHLTQPSKKIYYYTMEEGLYEVDVKDLSVTTYHLDGNVTPKPNQPSRAPLNGWHGKGAYSGQERLVVANNGTDNWQTAAASGVLAEWNGDIWTELEKMQFTEVTGPGGIYGNRSDSDPLWAVGWDAASCVLKLLDGGVWQTFRFPKASFTYDGAHGWHTEWPRIREVQNGRFLLTMHGMFWDFPASFRAGSTGGIFPLSSYQKVIADFAFWNGRMVFGCDDVSMFDNKFVGRPQSNLWFVEPQQLYRLGPRNAFGSVWNGKGVAAGEISDPFLMHGFDYKCIHLSHKSDKAVRFAVEIDKSGNGSWSSFKTVTLPPRGYAFLLLSPRDAGEWIRIVARDAASEVTARFFYTDATQREALLQSSLFASLPAVGYEGARMGALLRPGASDSITLEAVFPGHRGQPAGLAGKSFEVSGALRFSQLESDSLYQRLTRDIAIRQEYTFDDASVIMVDHQGVIRRLPKGSDAYDLLPARSMRAVREVATERSLLNCHGIFYELPRDISGGLACVKPIATHNRMIYDFCGWRGLMVMSGARAGARPDGHFFASDRGDAGLWFGVIDDLWAFGKPVGKGGPWKNSQVAGEVWSDPYLMTGFDKKQMQLEHNSAKPVLFTVEVDLTATGNWVVYDTFTVKPGKPLIYNFPDGYSAHWVRIKSDTPCRASALFTYF